MRTNNLRLLALQEYLFSRNHRTPAVFKNETVMQEINNAGWAGGGSLMLRRDDAEYSCIAKEVTDASKLIDVRIGDCTIIGFYSFDSLSKMPKLVQLAMDRAINLG